MRPHPTLRSPRVLPLTRCFLWRFGRFRVPAGKQVSDEGATLRDLVGCIAGLIRELVEVFSKLRKAACQICLDNRPGAPPLRPDGNCNVRARRFYERTGWTPDSAVMTDDSRGFPI